MNGNPEVITNLQRSLSLHWTALEAYRAQAAHFARHGYGKLAERAKADVSEEAEHADRLLGRLAELDAVADYAHAAPRWPELPDMPALLLANYDLEKAACEAEREAIRVARTAGDERTALLLAENLEGSESALVEIEAAMRQIAATGVDQWLAAML